MRAVVIVGVLLLAVASVGCSADRTSPKDMRALGAAPCGLEALAGEWVDRGYPLLPDWDARPVSLAGLLASPLQAVTPAHNLMVTRLRWSGPQQLSVVSGASPDPRVPTMVDLHQRDGYWYGESASAVDSIVLVTGISRARLSFGLANDGALIVCQQQDREGYLLCFGFVEAGAVAAWRFERADL